MDKRINIPAELYEDEVICFLADRYHTIPKIVLQCFFVQEGIALQEESPTDTFRLEDNEMEILRGLVFGSHHQEDITNNIIRNVI